MATYDMDLTVQVNKSSFFLPLRIHDEGDWVIMGPETCTSGKWTMSDLDKYASGGTAFYDKDRQEIKFTLHQFKPSNYDGTWKVGSTGTGTVYRLPVVVTDKKCSFKITEVN